MKRAGFTLIELLIAITILAIIMEIVYASFTSVVDTTQSTREEARKMRRQQFLAESFQRNLASTYADAQFQNPLYQFLGANVEGPDGPQDTLSFCSTAPIMGGTALPGDVKQVRYEFLDASASEMELGYDEMPDSEKRGGVIVATEVPLLGSGLGAAAATGSGSSATLGASSTGGDQNLTGDIEAVAPEWTLRDVRSMDITYFDGKDYLEEWDSMTEGRLPWFVLIKINFWKPKEQLDEERRDQIDPDEDPDLEMVIPTIGMGTVGTGGTPGGAGSGMGGTGGTGGTGGGGGGGDE